MTILGIDSSSKSASAAIIKDGKILCENYLNTGFTHSQTLMKLTQDCFSETGLSVGDLDYIAVSNGPGSFTGVRIGLAFVKGLAFTNNLKCCPVSTLESLAVNVKCFTGKVYCILDARCSQVYFAQFESDGKEIKRLCEDCALSLEEVKAKALSEEKNIILVGDGAEICFEHLKSDCKNVIISSENIRYTTASGVCAASCAEKAIDSDKLLPNYLRLPQAQRNLKKES
ncbi:MAG: tRNA (adenosine(37)-N6)-threonylcarbamoyltransferase complex dimerization subunit type 1 TsaB [Clostridia bacterium]|nr:tRNA (adenosine(37)-N6)-threonylcarbamoyltransferase complex dimerization subunit type 1 TsaB [Clostridia bacterium]